METKVVEGWDTWWKVLEGAWVVGTRGSEFRCYTECNNDPALLPVVIKVSHQCIVKSVRISTKFRLSTT